MVLMKVKEFFLGEKLRVSFFEVMLMRYFLKMGVMVVMVNLWRRMKVLVVIWKMVVERL